MQYSFCSVFIQAVSESLNTLVVAEHDASSSKDNTSDEAVTSSSLKEQATVLPEHDLASSEDADGKVAADDIMVQIRARKSEVGLTQQICQLFWQ